MMPDGAVPDQHHFDPSKLTALGSKGGAVEIGFPTGDSTLQDLANQIQVILQQAGLTATIRDFPSAQFFALNEHPEQRPDLLLASLNPDAAHPDTWSRIYQYTNAPVNLQGCSVPAKPTRSSTRAAQNPIKRNRRPFTSKPPRPTAIHCVG